LRDWLEKKQDGAVESLATRSDGKILAIERTLMQPFARDQEEGVPLLAADAAYPVWTPLNAFDAADTLLQMLKTHQAET
jgi:hypothetical protein